MIDVAYAYVSSRIRGNELKYVQNLSKQGYTLNTSVIGHNLTLVFEPSSVQHILVKNFENYPKGAAFHRAFSAFMGTGIFNADGAAWKNQRAIARPHFQVTEYKGAAHIETQINQVFGILDKAIEAGDILDVQDLWSRYTIDTATGFLFGACANALDVPQSKFVSAFNYTQKICGWKIRLCDYQSLIYAPEFPQKIKDMDAFLMPIVDQAVAKEIKRREDGKLGDANEDRHENLLTHFLNSVDENGKPFDRIYLRDMLMNFLLAGRDTSTNLLSFMCYHLGKYPDVMERVRQEIFEVVGRDRKPEHDDIKRLKFLKQVINETLRLYPAVPFNIKTSLEDDVLPNGYFVPKGSIVVHSSYVTHRMKEYWGEDAEEFDPDRWGPERVKIIRPFMFFPFHAGPRICLGQNFAYNQAMNTLTRLIQRYTWRVADGFEPIPESDITMYSRNGMQIIFEKYRD
ncbi:cytochrome P450 [Lobosporangium transversale]|uniref:Cytochrome P450 n=1 Tax=Lobosporangium transversale TaxID=64571 RepID=A0A1Y2GZG5_9FUNG|nr:cytochrome P450 [Lobosporangium transversale]ORZ27700.1 cytochrome P450 [Lobosporangium transversale]|eukprot:XP_021885403.1 cytochrome P450 [Lobosporangium transversale]